MRTEHYGPDADNNTVLLYVEDDGKPVEETSGYVDLVAGKAIVVNGNAGKSVLLTRNQDNTTLIGNLYIYSPNIIPGISFEIRSTNINDNGTVYWQIVE